MGGRFDVEAEALALTKFAASRDERDWDAEGCAEVQAHFERVLERAYAAGRVAGIEEAAGVPDRWVQEHLDDMDDPRDHRHCEDFGCGSLKVIAAEIRALVLAAAGKGGR